MGKVEKIISLMRDINKSISFPDSLCKEKKYSKHTLDLKHT